MPVHRTAPSRSLPLHPAMSQASTERSREVERERSREVERGPHTHTHTHTHTMGNIPRSQGGFGSCQMATTTQQGERLPLSACSQRLSNRVPCSVLKGCRTKLTCSVLLSFFCFAADSAELQGHTRYLMCVAATPPTPDFPQGQHLSQLPVHLLVFPHPFCMASALLKLLCWLKDVILLQLCSNICVCVRILGDAQAWLPPAAWTRPFSCGTQPCLLDPLLGW